MNKRKVIIFKNVFHFDENRYSVSLVLDGIEMYCCLIGNAKLGIFML